MLDIILKGSLTYLLLRGAFTQNYLQCHHFHPHTQWNIKNAAQKLKLKHEK